MTSHSGTVRAFRRHFEPSKILCQSQNTRLHAKPSAKVPRSRHGKQPSGETLDACSRPRHFNLSYSGASIASIARGYHVEFVCYRQGTTSHTADAHGRWRLSRNEGEMQLTALCMPAAEEPRTQWGSSRCYFQPLDGLEQTSRVR